MCCLRCSKLSCLLGWACLGFFCMAIPAQTVLIEHTQLREMSVLVALFKESQGLTAQGSIAVPLFVALAL